MRPNAKLENCIQFAASASVVGDGNNNNSVSVTVVTGRSKMHYHNSIAKQLFLFLCVWVHLEK
jgi:hypothetical protein